MTYATSRTVTPDELPPRGNHDPVADPGIEVDDTIGYQFCEFCESRGEPLNNPESVCDCTAIKRIVSGSQEATSDRFDMIMRLGETAALNHWAPSWERDFTLQKTVVPGQCSDQYSVHITFDGTISIINGYEPYESDLGHVEITGFNSDGTLKLGVTLSETAEQILAEPTDTTEPNSENDLYEVDEAGVCGNCGYVAAVVRHGHSSPDAGVVEHGDDIVRCKITEQPER